MTIEHIAFRGGPRDGEHLNDVGAAGLIPVISLPAHEGAHCHYRKTDEYSQLRATDMGEPYARIWFYEWLPDFANDS